MFQRKSPYEKELTLLEKKESTLLKKKSRQDVSALQRLLTDKVPAKLQNTLHTAFFSAFETVFFHGGGVIDKTFRPDERKKTYEINRCAAFIRPDKKNLRAFSAQAHSAGTKNLLLSGGIGTGLGLLGIGLPDIPVFVGLLLKNVYEIAISYGYGYKTTEEQYFILLLLQSAEARGASALSCEETVNQWIVSHEEITAAQLRDQMRSAANALADALLYVKFIQGIPIVGIVGGISDAICMSQITEYAALKYQRRFFKEKERNLR